MRLVTCQHAPQPQGLGHRMLVGRHRIAEGKVAEGLEGIVKFIEAAIPCRPPPVPLSKGLRPGGRKAQQPVAAVPHHVNGKVVSGEDTKFRPQPIAKGQSLPLQPPRQRRVLGPNAVGDLHELSVGLQTQHPAAGHESGSQFKPDEAFGATGQLPKPADHLGIVASGQTKRRKDHRHCTDRGDHGELPAIGGKIERGPRLVDHAGSRHQLAVADSLTGQPQGPLAGVVIDQMHVAGVHVDRRHDPGRSSAGHVGGEALPVDTAVDRERQQDRRDAADWPAGADEADWIHGHNGRRIG